MKTVIGRLVFLGMAALLASAAAVVADWARPQDALALTTISISVSETITVSDAPEPTVWSNNTPDNTPIGTQTGEELYPTIVPDTTGNSFIGWVRFPAYAQERLYVQKLNNNGDTLWPANGVAATPIVSSVYQNYKLVPDGAGGVYVVWRGAFMDFNGDGDVADDGEYFGAYRIYVQRLDSNGNLLWGTPVRVVTFDNDLYGPAAVSDGAGGVIIAWLGDYPNWHVSRDPTVTTVAVQRINGAGNRLWTDNGSLVFEPWDEVADSVSGSVSGNTSPIALAEDGAGGAFVAWSYGPTGGPISTARVNVTRINANGARRAGAYNQEGTYAGDVYISNPPDFKIVPDGLGGAILAWQGDDSSDFNIYAQRVGQNGSVVWQAGGAPVSTAPGGQGMVIGAVPPGIDMAADSTGGAFIAWEDNRPTLTYRTTYAQKLNSAGASIWAANGIQVPESINGAQSAPRVALDSQGGALFTWLQADTYTFVRGQRLSANGTRLWTADAALSDVNSNKDWLAMASTSPGKAAVAWTDSRNYAANYNDVYTQGFSSIPSAVVDVAETVAVSDTPAVLPVLSLDVAETVTVSDTPIVSPPAIIDVTETITVSDSPEALPVLSLDVAETVTVSDTPVVSPPAIIDVSEIVTVSDSPEALLVLSLDVSETVTVSDTPVVSPPAIIDVSETVTVSDTQEALPVLSLDVAETVTVSDTPVVSPPAIIDISETVTVADTPEITPPAIIGVSETISISDTVVASVPKSLDVQWVSHDTPKSIKPGQMVGVTINLTNTGSQTWPNSGANPVNVTYHWYDANWQPVEWGIGLRSSFASDVPSGQTVSITASLKAPSTAGTYNLIWDVVQEGVTWFSGQGAPLIAVSNITVAATQARDVQWVSHITPITIKPGQMVGVPITLTNTGNQIWPKGGANPVFVTYHWYNASWQPVEWGIGLRSSFASDVPIGQMVSITASLKAPSAAGTYNFIWDVVQEGVAWFSGQGAPLVAVSNITVAASQAKDLQWVSHITPATIKPGEMVGVPITLTNTGTQTWPYSGANPVYVTYHWYNDSWQPVEWGIGLRSSFAGDVPSGQMVSLTASLKAPSTSGTYNLLWDVVQESVAWFSGQGAPLLAASNISVAATQAKDVQWVSHNTPTSMTANQQLNITVTLTNTGSQSWSKSGVNPVYLSYHWLNASTGAVVVWNGIWSALPQDITSGQMVTLTASLQSPAIAGTYNLTWDVVQDGVGWFSGGGAPLLPVSGITVNP